MFIFIKKIIAKIFPPRIYWTLAGFVNPYSAAISGQKVGDTFYPLGNYELELFKKLNVINKNFRTLEVGCGPGRIQWALKQNDLELEVHGTDFALSMVRLARKNVPGASFSLGNGKNLNQYENDFFDLVYSFVVFQHIDEEIFREYLRETYRILKPNGFLVFQIQSSEQMTDYERPRGHPWLLRHYMRDEVYDMLKECGFVQIQIFDMQGRPDPKAVDESGFLFLAQK